MSTPMAYQSVKKMRELLTDVELALHRGSAVTGPTAAPQFNGLLNSISTYNTSSSGTTLRTWIRSVSLRIVKFVENWVNSVKPCAIMAMAIPS